ncbi:REP-associated tyrosine transposase [Pontiella agarivorans]|uniref:Transposase n=1 Tax=Pontiella agarivorans TaxID=3038953 RepID=A0ABU5N1J1_9BACT|nr:transposase [Pontiella agarivorans]MDZ8120292.1 transposase [Pontiella agarivorans]
MPERRHLKRLGCVYQSHPRYFITTCTYHRRNLLAHSAIHEILREHWAKSLDLYGWPIGSYVIMPDHVHFFCADVGSTTPLSKMIGAWKQWSAKAIGSKIGIQAPLWQREFFDHLIRSDESYSEKWDYIRQNPVRAGLVEDSKDWKYSGHIHYV